VEAVPSQFEHLHDAAEFKRPLRPGVELYRARIVHHAFEPHTHAAFGLGVIETGVERFRYRGSDHLAPTDSLVLMNPDELHTGRAETPDGWSYRMVYLDETALEAVAGEPGWWFRQAVQCDAPRARRVNHLLQALWHADEPLAFDSALSLLIDELRPHACVPRPARADAAQRFEPVLEHMRCHLHRRLTLDELAGVAGLSPFHFLRSFKLQHHATPQQVLMALRLFAAKEMLARGEPAAQVAAASGLTDQAHLTRAFVRRYGVTPGRYQQQLGTRRRLGA
jgi:AraC-like DNA-binding protein